jgi:hypothetical protein
MEPFVRLRASGMAEMFRAFGNVWKKEYARILRSNAADTAEQLALRSYPTPTGKPQDGMGNTTEAQRRGEANVRRDLYKMFRPLDSFSVRELVRQKNMAVFELANPIDWRDDDLRKAWEGRDMETLYNTFSRLTTHVGEADEFEYGEQEEQLEGIPYVPQPSIQDQRKMMSNGRWDGRSKMLVKNRQVLAKFVAERIKSVGKMANGWVLAALKLGAGGRVRHIMTGKGEGDAKFKTKKGGGEWILTNKHGDPNGMMTQVIQEVAAEQLMKLSAAAKALTAKAAQAARVASQKNRPPAPTPTSPGTP